MKTKGKMDIIKIVAVIIVFPIVVFYAIGGNGEFDWEKKLTKTKELVRKRFRG